MDEGGEIEARTSHEPRQGISLMKESVQTNTTHTTLDDNVSLFQATRQNHTTPLEPFVIS